jgi:predicted enzyme related to lactoylglutathione lyase
MGKLNFIIIDCADPDKVSRFWSQALHGYTVDKQEWGITMKADSGPSIYFEVVPEGKTVKNRLHLNIAAADRKEEVARLVSLGATAVEEMSPGGGYEWTNMTDVEGNEFCVSQAQ